MSAINHDAICALETRSMYVRAGYRKAAKTRYVRAERKRGKAEVAQEVASLPLTLDTSANLSAWADSPEALEAMADEILRRAEVGFEADELARYGLEDLGMLPKMCDEAAARELESFRMLEQLSEVSSRIPLHLQASLPDWMLERLEDANGSAFDVLSLFEAKSPSPKAAISMDDEVMYA